MKFNFKEYEVQDLMSKGPMRRRYNDLVERYKGYTIYSYVRGEYTRYSVEDENENIYVETDNIEEAREYVDNELANKQKHKNERSKKYAITRFFKSFRNKR